MEREAREERKKAKEETEKDSEKNPGFFAKLFGKDEEEDNDQEKNPKPIIIWDKEEVDFGSFHKYLNWSPDGRTLVYAKYHFGKHQSMINDIKVYNIDDNSSKWLTQSERATYPDWSPDGKQLVYVAHETSLTNL